MELYKKMYLTITDALECENKLISDEILKNAQIKTEEMYIDNDFK